MTQKSTRYSRRSFLATAGMTVAAGAAARALGQTQPANTPPAAVPEKPVGFALVGIGALTQGQLFNAFAHTNIARLTGLVSGHPDKANAAAARYNIPAKNIYNYDNFDAIKDNPDIDVIYIVLPNGMHAEYTIRAAKAGKHVLCEKPMANTAEECQAMIDACAIAKRKLMVAYRQRYEPLTMRAIELAQSAADIGTIKQISGEAGFNAAPNQWRLTKKLAGGGPLMDMGIYAVNAIRYLSAQEPVEVMAMSYSTPGDPRFTEVEETITFDLRFASGMLASVLSTYSFNCNRFRLYGTAGQLESEPMQTYTNNKLWLTRNRGGKQEITVTPVNHFAAEMDHMCACILHDKAPLTPGEEGLKDMKIIMAAYESARTGKAVKM